MIHADITNLICRKCFLTSDAASISVYQPDILHLVPFIITRHSCDNFNLVSERVKSVRVRFKPALLLLGRGRYRSGDRLSGNYVCYREGRRRRRWSCRLMLYKECYYIFHLSDLLAYERFWTFYLNSPLSC